MSSNEETFTNKTTGFVAKKVALFQQSVSEDNSSQSHHKEALKLHRKNAVKRKGGNKILPKSNNIEDELYYEFKGSISSTNSSLMSSSPIIGSETSLSEPEYQSLSNYKIGTKIQNYSGFYAVQNSDLSRAKKFDILSKNSFSSRNIEKNERRKLKDCYQSFTLPFIPGRLQLVEFNEILLSGSNSSREEDESSSSGIYEQLDSYYDDKNYDENNIKKNNREDEERMQRLSSSTSSLNITSNHNQNIAPINYNSKDEDDVEERIPCLLSSESLYSEPIYGDTGGTCSSSTDTYWANNSSIYNNQSTSSLKFSPDPPSGVLLNNTRITKSSISPQIPVNLRNLQNPSPSLSSTTNYGFRPELPPLPRPNSSSSTQNKFSSIAKSAGKLLTKKLSYIRKGSLKNYDETYEEPKSLPNQTRRYSQPNGNSASSSSSLQNLNISLNSASGTVLSKEEHRKMVKRQISRPSIPPPEPPKLPPIKSIQPVEINNEFEDNDDDFDDSDFCDSDSELIRNFVSAVQPIYSMEEEPLYQYYTYGISLQPEDDYQPIIPKNLGLTLDMLVPRMGQRTLWCEIQEVVSSGILSILSDKQKQLQEAIFEILTSEVSYLKSIEVLISLFYNNMELNHVLSEGERAALFGNILQVKECSESFLGELLLKWEESWYIHEVGEVLNENAKSRFRKYVDYCRNKPYQDKTLQNLRSSSDEFVNVLKGIEQDPKCQMLRLDSFLVLPMQRITRLPLLVNAILQRTQSSKEKTHCEEALKSLTDLVFECNEAARESQDAEETAAIMEKLEFPRGMRSIRSPGQFVLKGDFMKNPFENSRGGVKLNWTFQKSKRTYFWLILFTNQLFITRKRSTGRFEVIDIVASTDTHIKILPDLEGISKDYKHYFMLHFEGKETVYFLAGKTQSEIDRWKQNLEQLKSSKTLRVEAVFPYEAKRDDELTFTVGDVIEVSQTQPDGWYFGALKKNGEEIEGWFPGNYTAEL